MSKPLYESVDEKVWMILVALFVLAMVVLSIIGAVNVSNNYVEEPNPIYDPYYYEKYEGRRFDDFR
jgi:quinol-cytochrome oxidoreductase complex cytochrome b subunit